VHDMIVEGLYLGGWPFLSKHLPPGSPSVIDCTCELPRSSFIPADDETSIFVLQLGIQELQHHAKLNLPHVGLVKRDLRGNRFMSTVHLAMEEVLASCVQF